MIKVKTFKDGDVPAQKSNALKAVSSMSLT